jgi:hypothetical protein
MTTLACLAVAGVLIGLFFNSYALAVFCVAIALVETLANTRDGISHNVILLITSLFVVQIAYVAGLTSSSLFFRPKRHSVSADLGTDRFPKNRP